MSSQTKAVKLHPEARAELREAVSFYRERVGDRWAGLFKERVAEGLNAIAANPERYRPVPDLPGVQTIRLKQFPFSLLYINRADHIWVVAVAHGSRKPGYWKDRIP
jgi:toxin ParE1/3/4